MPDMFLKSDVFPSDVRARAEELLASCGGQSVGAYSDSAGVPVIRKHVAEYISQRDGVTTLPENVILQGGASEAIRVNKTPAFQCPILIERLAVFWFTEWMNAVFSQSFPC